MKAIILARVSTLRQERDGLSLEDIQLPDLRKYAEEKGIEVVQEFIFSESADSKIRKKFNEVVDFVKADKSITAVIAFRVDRITRNFRDAVLCDDLRLNYDIELHFVHDRLVIHKDSSGRDIQDWDLKVFLAKQQLNRLKDDANNTADTLLRLGRKPGRAPIGYRNITLPDGRTKDVIPDPERAPFIVEMFNLYAQGSHSYLSLYRLMKEKGLTASTGTSKAIPKSLVEHIMHDPFYYGVQRYKDKLYPHTYQPLIEKWLFDKCQGIIDGRKHTNYKYNSKPFAFRNLITCHNCGGTIGLDIKKGKYRYCFCNKYPDRACDTPRQHESDLIEQVKTGIIEHLSKITSETIQDVVSDMQKKETADSSAYTSRFELISKKIETLDAQNRTMYQDRLAGRITPEQYDELATANKTQIAQLQGQLSQSPTESKDLIITAEYLLSLLQKVGQLYESSKEEHKQRIHTFLLSNCTLKQKELVWELNKPFDAVLNCSKSSIWLPRLGSNQRHPR